MQKEEEVPLPARVVRVDLMNEITIAIIGREFLPFVKGPPVIHLLLSTSFPMGKEEIRDIHFRGYALSFDNMTNTVLNSGHEVLKARLEGMMPWKEFIEGFPALLTADEAGIWKRFSSTLGP